MSRERDEVELSFAPDEGQLGTRPSFAGTAVRGERPVRSDRRLSPACVQLTDRPVADELLGGLVSDGTDEDCARLGCGLEPRRRIHDVAHRRVVVAGGHCATEGHLDVSRGFAKYVVPNGAAEVPEHAWGMSVRGMLHKSATLMGPTRFSGAARLWRRREGDGGETLANRYELLVKVVKLAREKFEQETGERAGAWETAFEPTLARVREKCED